MEGQSSPYVFGGSQPRGLSEAQWDRLAAQGFTFVRTQADVTKLVPCPSPEAYRRNENGCADPANGDWINGIYGDEMTPTVDLWRLMSLRLELGDGPSTVVYVDGAPYTSAFAALNPTGDPLSDQGLFDGEAFQFVELWVEAS